MAKEEAHKERLMMKESFIKCDTHPELMLPNAHRVSLSLLQVKNGDTHPPEDRDPLVPLDLVVGEAVDFVIHLALVEDPSYLLLAFVFARTPPLSIAAYCLCS